MSNLGIISDYFLTAGSDNIVKMFHYENKENPLIMVELKGETLADITWVPQNPNFMVAAAAEGNLYIYDLGDTIEKPRESINVPINSVDQIQSICVSGPQNSLVAISRLGNVWQFEISSALHDDRFMLDKVYTG